jgi:hypothetical protein
MINAAPINLELVADNILPSLIKVSSPEANKKQTINSAKNEPRPFNVFIRLDLLAIIFLIPKYNTDATMMKRITYALYNIISIPKRKSERISKTKRIPRRDNPKAVYLIILYFIIIS